METAAFDYHLPPELIAQTPLPQRDASRLLHLNSRRSQIAHYQFQDIVTLLQPGDILVANNSRVLPARLYGRKASGGQVEILLLAQQDTHTWQAMVGGKRIKKGTAIQLLHDGKETALTGIVTAVFDGPVRDIQFSEPLLPHLETVGQVPLPPYIRNPLADSERYQTIYAQSPGSAAAPTAGLHFTPELLLALREKGVLFETCTLHVGLDTFKPVTAAAIQQHQIHSEWASLSLAAAQRINEAKLAGGRLVAVGTTAVRTLETAALRAAGITGSLQTMSQRDAEGETAAVCPWRPAAAFSGPTDLFIYPGYRFRAVDMMITNFHLPKSSLLMLVSAFAGREQIMQAYEAAIAANYRFFSFGDAMLIG